MFKSFALTAILGLASADCAEDLTNWCAGVEDSWEFDEEVLPTKTECEDIVPAEVCGALALMVFGAIFDDEALEDYNETVDAITTGMTDNDVPITMSLELPESDATALLQCTENWAATCPLVLADESDDVD